MTAQDWQQLIVASNEAAMQWYSLVTQNPLPTQITQPLPGGGTARIGAPSMNSVLLIGVLVVAAIVLLKD